MIKRICITIACLILLMPVFAQSRGVRVLKSAVLPGLGQVSSGHQYGYGMMAAELGIIGSLLYFRNESELKAQEYKDYAVQFAHIQPGVFNTDYYSHLSRYDHSGFGAGGYNAMVRQQAIKLYPDDPALQQQYIDAYAYTDDMAWSWDELSNRREYSQMRIKTQDLKDFAKIATGVLVLNHLVSVIDILRYPVGDKAAFSMKFDGDRRLIVVDVPF